MLNHISVKTIRRYRSSFLRVFLLHAPSSTDHPRTLIPRSLCPVERSDLKSENTGLPVELRMPNVYCASFRRNFNIIFLVSNNKPEINMASSETSLSSDSDSKGQGVNFALLVIGRENVTLEEKPMQILCCQPVSASQSVSLPTYDPHLWHSSQITWIILASDRQNLTQLS